MKKLLLILMGLLILNLSSTAFATLLPRWGGAAVYDTDLNITWLSDANYAKTSGYDSDGLMTWLDATAWAASLNIGGFTDWRLPTMDSACNEISVSNCINSEMGHLFYTELSGTANSSILTSGDPDLALFSNIQYNYWSDTLFVFNQITHQDAWFFSFHNGHQSIMHFRSSDLSAWAVHSGDIFGTQIPEPGTLVLMGLGLAGLLGFRRGQHRS